MSRHDHDPYAELRELARPTNAARERDKAYFTTRSIRPGRDFLIACRHWNSSTPIVPRSSRELLSYARVAGASFGGGYFLVANGMGMAIDPGYAFMQLLRAAYGFTICDVDAVFITHDHPDHWADLANILVLKHMATRERDTPSRTARFYLSRSLTDLYSFLAPGTPDLTILAPGQVASLEMPGMMNGVDVTGLKAFHSERVCPQRNSPHPVGLRFCIHRQDGSGRPCTVAIAGDTQFPSVDIKKDGLREFLQGEVTEFREQYQPDHHGGRRRAPGQGTQEIDVLAMHIGSVEPDLASVPTGADDALEFIKEKVFYPGYHLGFAGCLRLLDTAFRRDQAGKLAILTEFGEELRGRRVDLAKLLEQAASANDSAVSGKAVNVRVLPADIGMAVELSFGPDGMRLKLRCSKCLRLLEAAGTQSGSTDTMHPALFHPISEMAVFEDPDSGLIHYTCGHW